MTLPVAEIAAYLRSAGWHVTSNSWRGARVWARDDVEVLLPARDDLRDNPARIRDVLRTVADVEQRPVEEVARDVTRPHVDVAAFRGTPDDDTLALPAGLQAVAGLRDLMGTAARTVLEGPHLHFPGRAPAPVGALLARTRLAFGPDTGCTLLVPTADEAGLSGRDVVLQFHDAALAVDGAARAEDIVAFDTTVTAGVSAEFCAALSALAGPDRDAPFEVAFRWGHGRPAVVPARSVAFPAGTGRVVRAAALRLRRVEVRGAATAAGVVDGLHDEEGSADRWRVRVRGAVTAGTSGSPRGAIWVRLPDRSTYDRAVEAWSAGRRLRAEGSLTSRDGRVELATAAEGIEIVDEPEADRAR